MADLLYRNHKIMYWPDTLLLEAKSKQQKQEKPYSWHWQAALKPDEAMQHLAFWGIFSHSPEILNLHPRQWTCTSENSSSLFIASLPFTLFLAGFAGCCLESAHKLLAHAHFSLPSILLALLLKPWFLDTSFLLYICLFAFCPVLLIPFDVAERHPRFTAPTAPGHLACSQSSHNPSLCWVGQASWGSPDSFAQGFRWVGR